MTHRVREGIVGLCVAVVAGVAGLVLPASGFARFLVFLAVLVAVVSIGVLITELARKAPPE